MENRHSLPVLRRDFTRLERNYLLVWSQFTACDDYHYKWISEDIIILNEAKSIATEIVVKLQNRPFASSNIGGPYLLIEVTVISFHRDESLHL